MSFPSAVWLPILCHLQLLSRIIGVLSEKKKYEHSGQGLKGTLTDTNEEMGIGSGYFSFEIILCSLKTGLERTCYKAMAKIN